MCSITNKMATIQLKYLLGFFRVCSLYKAPTSCSKNYLFNIILIKFICTSKFFRLFFA